LNYSYFCSPDDLTLGENGIPPGTVERRRQYSWAYLVRLPTCAPTLPDSPYFNVMDLTVVVYSGRSLDATTDPVPQGETLYTQASFQQGSTTATITWDPTKQDRPAVRRGGWIMDATLVPPPGGPPMTPRGYFYRVIDVQDIVAPPGLNALQLELQTGARAGVAGQAAQALVLDGVVEVFEKAPLTP
jgi:hypothetical protein